MNPWAFRGRKSARDLAFQLGVNLGFKGQHSSEQLLEFLRQIEPKELVLASEKLCPTHVSNQLYRYITNDPSLLPPCMPDISIKFSELMRKSYILRIFSLQVPCLLFQNMNTHKFIFINVYHLNN